MLRGTLDKRTVILGEYIVEHKSTVRAAAKSFGISKSTVHAVVIIWNVFGGLFNNHSAADNKKAATLCRCFFIPCPNFLRVLLSIGFVLLWTQPNISWLTRPLSFRRPTRGMLMYR